MNIEYIDGYTVLKDTNTDKVIGTKINGKISSTKHIICCSDLIPDDIALLETLLSSAIGCRKLKILPRLLSITVLSNSGFLVSNTDIIYTLDTFIDTVYSSAISSRWLNIEKNHPNVSIERVDSNYYDYHTDKTCYSVLKIDEQFMHRNMSYTNAVLEDCEQDQSLIPFYNICYQGNFARLRRPIKVTLDNTTYIYSDWFIFNLTASQIEYDQHLKEKIEAKIQLINPTSSNKLT